MKNVISIFFQRALSDRDWKYYHYKESEEREKQGVGISMLINGYKKDFCSRKEGRIVIGEIQQGRWSSKG